jgi:hypothetical protein
MSTEDIPDVVLDFIDRYIDTVPHLETLLLLWEDPSRRWTQEEVAQRIYVGIDAAGSILSNLSKRRLATIETQHPPLFRYNPDWEGTSSVMPEVAGAYRRRLVQIATLIHTRGSASVREFARAFEIKKDR